MTVSDLEALTERLRADPSDASEMLRPFLVSGDYEVRQEAYRVFAQTCVHSSVSAFEASIEVAEDGSELGRIAVRLGETLSPAAIPVLLQMIEDHGDQDIEGYVAMGLETLFGFDVSEDELAEASSFQHLRHRAEALAQRSVYVYKGEPVFVGTFTKELVTMSLISNHSKEPVLLVGQGGMLTAFSGLPCPVTHGVVVDDALLGEVYAYVQQIASGEWLPGRKYFWGRPIA